MGVSNWGMIGGHGFGLKHRVCNEDRTSSWRYLSVTQKLKIKGEKVGRGGDIYLRAMHIEVVVEVVKRE